VKCKFIFCLHNHQPVGNFKHVFEWAFRSCYEKTINLLKEYPEFSFAIHHSGPILEWIRDNAPDYLDTVRMMVERNQVEIIGGGFYEPVFSVISEADIRGQIVMLQNFCTETFGSAPRGFWTAERVWDPEIPRLVSGMNMTYTILDDNHFRYAGIEEEELHGYYITERLRYPLMVFPIDKFLRYSIPFKLPSVTIDYFRDRAEKGIYDFVYGDDGEKFGVWPGTEKWVFEERWLMNFVEAVLACDWLEMIHPSSFIEAYPPTGRVYLTQGSYYELSEWALPSPVALKLWKLHKEIEEWDRKEEFYPFLKGGVWNNFLNKYPESNAINKRTLLLSKEVEEYENATGNTCDDVKIELYRSECNCAYWHGFFGGIYLNSLRHALYEHLLRAESLFLNRIEMNDLQVIESDFWHEGHQQILVRKRDQSTIFLPRYGGTISEIGIYNRSTNIFDVLARRFEAYHEKLSERNEVAESGNDASVESIHDMSLKREEGIENYLVYDNRRRYSFKDLIGESLPSAEELMNSSDAILDCSSLIYHSHVERREQDLIVSFEREIDVAQRSLSLCKEYTLSEDRTGVRAAYRIQGGEGLYFGIECNLNLLSECDERRRFILPAVELEDSYLNVMGRHEGILSFSLVDEYDEFRVIFSSSREMVLVRYPIYTVSQSDKGFEKNFQGTAVILFYHMEGTMLELDVEMMIQ